MDSFRFTNRDRESCFVRYQFIPGAGERFLSPEESSQRGPRYLAEEIKARVAQGPVSFRLCARVAEPGDNVGDPSIAWPDARRRVPLGTVRIERVAANTPAPDRAAAFNPGNVPAGIEAADDMVRLRAAAYPVSVKERQ